MRASKNANLVKTFLHNHIPHERKLFKEELFAYHEDQEVFYWYESFKLYEFE
jgi:hypothetical protein